MRGECDVIIRPAAYNYILPEVECDRSYVIPGLTIAAQQWYQFTAGETLEQRNFARKLTRPWTGSCKRQSIKDFTQKLSGQQMFD